MIDSKKTEGNNHPKLVNNTRTGGILNNNATGGSPLSPNSNANSNTSDSKTNSLFKKVIFVPNHFNFNDSKLPGLKLKFKDFFKGSRGL